MASELFGFGMGVPDINTVQTLYHLYQLKLVCLLPAVRAGSQKCGAGRLLGMTGGACHAPLPEWRTEDRPTYSPGVLQAGVDCSGVGLRPADEK